LLTDHIVFSPKYRGKVLVGDVAMVAEAETFYYFLMAIYI